MEYFTKRFNRFKKLIIENKRMLDSFVFCFLLAFSLNPHTFKKITPILPPPKTTNPPNNHTKANEKYKR